MIAECAYCGCDVAAHDPVYVEETVDGERAPAGQFCNYACLVQYVEREGLQEGTYCSLDAA